MRLVLLVRLPATVDVLAPAIYRRVFGDRPVIARKGTPLPLSGP